MILRFSSRDTYSILTRLMTNRSKLVVAARTASKHTSVSTPELISVEINKLYNKTFKEGQLKARQLSSSELSKVRASQRQQNIQLNRRRVYEKLSLYSYLNVCVDVGQINRAFNTLIKLSSPRKSCIVDINHYNVVLKGWAKLGSIAQVVETRMHMIKNKVEPNSVSYTYILLAYAKGHESRKTTIKRLYQDMKSRNIDPSCLFHHSYMSASERQSIIDLLKQVEPAYIDQFCPEPIEYNCKLLANYNQSERVPYNFSDINEDQKLDSWANHQRFVEAKSSVTIKSIATVKEPSHQIEKFSKLWNRYIELWKRNLTKALDDSLEILRTQSEDPEKIHLYPYICSVDKTLLINLMLDEVETNASYSTYSTSTNHMHLSFGNKVMTRYLKAKAVDDGSHQEKQKIYHEYLREYCTNPELMSRLNPRQFIQTKAKDTKNYSVYRDKLELVDEWPHHIVAAVGRFLYGLILREIKFDPETVRNTKREINMNNLVHAFYTAYFQIDCSHKIKEEFRAHQDFERLQHKANAVKLKFDYSFLPCASPPLPWLSRRFGGYLTNKSDLVRVSNPFAEQSYVSQHQSSDSQKLYPSLDSLNAISICPWIVNKEILDLVIFLFQSGGDTELNVPLDESRMDAKLPTLKENASKADRILFNKEKKRYDQKRREMYSLWRDCLYRLSIANHFRDRTFWFPHNMDFRGRTYPVPPHFNHLGADLARSLLLFAKGRPLGDNGLDWLKLHLVNLVGTKKSLPLGERLEYANSILHSEILDSADNPWDGRRWWQANENPWQVLACCKEIAKAIRSRDYRSYISHFPVHQDGSCNGLQHYAALGRDPKGALAVNLVPCERPQDVYSRVVEIVEAMRVKEAAKGDKLAKMLEGFIQRKVIKQTVMTTVYGVTRYGARQQIARQLIAKGYSEREVWQAAQYLTAKTFESIGQMFNKSRVIQDWLNDCAFIIASRCRQPVSWETPLGFSVTQPYTLPIITSANRLLSSNISLDSSSINNDPLSRLNAPKQKTAFPPNYIHSLDSSHMMLTSLYCFRQGVTFVSVHDCYWTHPCTVDAMNRICREQFIALHSEPLLKDLADQFMSKFALPSSTALAGTKKASKASKKSTESAAHVVEEEKQAAQSAQLLPNCTRPLADIYEDARQAAQDKLRAKFAEVPSTGELDLNVILNSTYFFS